MEDEPTFTFSEARTVLAAVARVAPPKMKTFEARLQQLQKMGLPKGTNVGRSGRAQYLGWQLAEIILYLSLLDGGITAAALKQAFAVPQYGTGGFGPHLEARGASQYLALHPHALNYLRTSDPSRAGPALWDHNTRLASEPGDILKDVVSADDALSAAIVVNVAKQVSALKSVIAEMFPDRARRSLFPSSWRSPDAED
jgi:hypothetical protein